MDIRSQTTSENLARFLAKVDARHGPWGCWEWQGSLHTRTRYGSFHVSRGTRGKFFYSGAHRFAMAWLGGEDVPSGATVMHACDNPPCCNPEHLRLGSQTVNLADMTAKGRRARGEAHGDALRKSVTKPRGERSNFAVFSDQDILLYRALRALGLSAWYAGPMVGMTYFNARFIDAGKRRIARHPIQLTTKVFAAARVLAREHGHVLG